ncbi:glucodextranase DOMON-like domain-containing protein [Haloparvum sedimenti]|uniref:glucodextranase DOMON-like domain-containing protein n=1 Tax=Haloparvum sedimenti TaxID=1678448 RepID=UPI00071E9ACC|nr:glucodextranase DOMON-like domain-containing protein [Haloparvum sedimenti]
MSEHPSTDDATRPTDTARGRSDGDATAVRRRSILGGIAGLGVFGAVPSATAAAGNDDARGLDAADSETAARTPTGTDSFHPGHPRFVTVGEKLWNSAWVGPDHITDRDNLAPGVPSPSRDPDGYDAGDFEWSVVERPDASDAGAETGGEADGGAKGDAGLTFASSLYENRPRYDEGRDNVAEFEADAPGTYVLELDAPDGTHRLTVEALPAPGSDAAGGPPRVELGATYDAAAGTFTVDSNAELAPDSDAAPDDLSAHFLADDRDALATADVEVIAEGEGAGTTATVDTSALGGESARVHAVAHDGERTSVVDTVELHPDGSVDLPNRPPEWIREGVVYQIFTRSWAGVRDGTTFDTLVDGSVDPDAVGEGEEPPPARGVDYLDELGVDAVWLTPVHPAVSAERELPGGGPHGYDITDYFGVAEDLAPAGTDPLAAYREFIDACHERDIRVVLDLVVNHCGRSMPEFQGTIASRSTEPEFWPTVESWATDADTFDWFDRVDAPLTSDGETVAPAPHPTGFWNLRLHPNFNFDNVALREYMLAVADFWSGEVGVDGFRCDIAWGVPHSFWKDVREVCRANDAEFLLLDEAIPNDPAFAENEFDMHFDTGRFTTGAHAVVRGEADGETLLDAVRDRPARGFPDHTLFLNCVENHDEFRALNEALDGSRGDPKKAQRATWAAGVTLPGVPHVYYGQERAISEFGEGRHRGEDDPRSGDVSPEGRKRAFMNWDEYDADHLAFYRDLIDAYHDLDALKPGAALSSAWHNARGDVLAFGRDASDRDDRGDRDLDGPERVVVLINFEDGPATVYLRPEVDGTDLVTGADVSVETPSDATAVEVDTVAVLETPSLLDLGEAVAAFDAPSDTDYGPGGYTYPTDEEYADGAFDLVAFDVRETADAYQFRAQVDGDLTNPRDYPAGFSHQHLQVYLRDPEADGGTTAAREGVNAALAAPYRRRLVVDGRQGARLEDPEGNVVTEGEVTTNDATDAIVASVPKAAVDAAAAEERGVGDLHVVPLLLGYDPDAPGGVTPVNAEAGAHAFGGGREDDANPNVLDLLVDIDVDRESALDYAEDDPAEVGYVPLVTPFEEVATFDAPTGTPPGPGTYETPTGGDYYEGAWDIAGLTVRQSRDRVRFEYEFAEPLRNPWGFDVGFSHQLPQVYINDPETDDPATTRGRTGTNVAFEAPYNYRINVNPESGATVENAAGDGVTTDVTVTSGEKTITVGVPRDPIGWDTEGTGVALAAVVCPFDGFGEGGLRAVAAEAGEHTIGGGTGENDPRVMDAVTPEGVDRTSVLSEYAPNSPAMLPYVTVGDLSRGDVSTDNAGESAESGEGGTATPEPTDTEETAASATGSEDATESGVPGFGAAAGAAGIAGGAGAAAAVDRLADRSDNDDNSDDGTEEGATGAGPEE